MLFLTFIGVPFFLFLAGLLAVYYCCTSDPIPFRTLLRAMVGVEDWNGGAFDGTTGGEPYNVTKDDIRKGIIRRLCLGPMEPKAEVDTVGGDLATLPRDHPGRVHWRNEATSVTCLVFSEPLGSSASSEDEPPAPQDGEAVDNRDPAEPNAISAEEIARREELLRPRIPKYLQQHEQEEEKVEENVEYKKRTREEGEAANIGEINSQDSDKTIEEQRSNPEEPVQSPTQDLAHDDDSSVRDRGTVCDICLLGFETGEAVAWSPNPACNHAYHEDCITDWLLRKPTCPSCRQNFILLPTVRPGDENQSNASSGILEMDDIESSNSGEISRDDSSMSERNDFDALQLPSATAEDGDVELGTSGRTSIQIST